MTLPAQTDGALRDVEDAVRKALDADALLSDVFVRVLMADRRLSLPGRDEYGLGRLFAGYAAGTRARLVAVDGIPVPDETAPPFTNLDATRDRNPYVGDGADGARRSAQIDREEVDGLDLDDPRVPELLRSAEAWERQAARLEVDEIRTVGS